MSTHRFRLPVDLQRCVSASLGCWSARGPHRPRANYGYEFISAVSDVMGVGSGLRQGWVETTYVDETFRIGHGDKGSVFITARKKD